MLDLNELLRKYKQMLGKSDMSDRDFLYENYSLFTSWIKAEIYFNSDEYYANY